MSGKATVAKAHSKTPDPSGRRLECAMVSKVDSTPLHISKFMKPPIFTSYDIANQLCWFAEYNKGGFFAKLTVAKQQLPKHIQRRQTLR
jgi:hypothetical protein